MHPPRGPIGRGAHFELLNLAPGAGEFTLYDLQGRRMTSRRFVAGADGRHDFELGAGELPAAPGVYFARVRDAAGIESPAVRVVVLK